MLPGLLEHVAPGGDVVAEHARRDGAAAEAVEPPARVRRVPGSRQLAHLYLAILVAVHLHF